MVPPPQEWYQRLQIPVAAGESAAFVAGDGLDGYYDGRVGPEIAGSAYRHRSGYRFRYPRFRVDGIELAAAAAGFAILPDGWVAQWPNGCSARLAIHRDRRGVSLRLSVPRGSRLGVQAVIEGGTAADLAAADDSGGAALILPLAGFSEPAGQPGVFADRPPAEACPGWAAAMADSDCQVAPAVADPDGRPSPGDEVQHWLTSTGSCTSLTVSLGFGSTLQEALTTVRELFRVDPIAHEQVVRHELLTRSWFWCDEQPDYSRAVHWAAVAADSMVVREFGTGIWAGLPWFKDYWGRDTFITLPGALLVTGRFAEAREVIESFAELQCTDPDSRCYGRVPNRVTTPETAIYNTTDGTPWLLREIREYLDYTGDHRFAQRMYPTVERAIEGALRYWVDDEGFLTHDAADTWMDAKFDPGDRPAVTRPDADAQGLLPWSGRGSRAIEIQVLWHTALLAAVEVAAITGRQVQRDSWQAAAEHLAGNLLQRFWDPTRQRLADRLRPDDSPDWTMRPNQLMLLSLPLHDRPAPPGVEQAVVESAVPALVLPWGVLSLSPDHRDARGRSWFHPYHDNRPEYHKDAAYHNGAIWHWNAGFAVTALVRTGAADSAWELSRNLTAQLLELGCRGSLSENLDPLPRADGGLQPTGTFSQAWSVAEFARTAYQDYAGMRPDLLHGRVALYLGAPTTWREYQAGYAIGTAEHGGAGRLLVRYARAPRQSGGEEAMQLELRLCGYNAAVCVSIFIQKKTGAERAAEVTLEPEQAVQCTVAMPGSAKVPLAGPLARTGYDVLQGRDVLEGIIRRGEDLEAVEE